MNPLPTPHATDHFGFGSDPAQISDSRVATSSVTRISASTRFSSTSVAPSYSARFLMCACSSTRHFSSGMPRESARHWNTRNDFLLYSRRPATLPRKKRVQHYKRDRTGIRGSTALSSHPQVGRIQSEPAPIPRRLSTAPPGAYRWPRDYPGTHSASRLPIRTLCGPCRIRVRNPAFAARRLSNSVDV